MTEPELQYGSVNFFVCLLDSFEQVPVPGVTENRYLAYAERWGWLCEGRNLVFRLGVPQVNAYMYGTKFSTRVDAGVVGCTYIYFGVGHSRTSSTHYYWEPS